MKKGDQVMACGAASAFMNGEGMQETFLDRAIASAKALSKRSEGVPDARASSDAARAESAR